MLSIDIKFSTIRRIQSVFCHDVIDIVYLSFPWLQDYYVADASEEQVFVVVSHNTTVNHLYISDITGSKYSLSLENIVYFNPKGAHKNSWLKSVHCVFVKCYGSDT